jgi:hypothetical protein
MLLFILLRCRTGRETRARLRNLHKILLQRSPVLVMVCLLQYMCFQLTSFYHWFIEPPWILEEPCMSVSGNDRRERITCWDIETTTQSNVCQIVTLKHKLQILTPPLIFLPPGLPTFDLNFYRVVLMHIAVTSFVGVSTPSLLHPVMTLSLFFHAWPLDYSLSGTIPGLPPSLLSRPGDCYLAFDSRLWMVKWMVFCCFCCH